MGDLIKEYRLEVDEDVAFGDLVTLEDKAIPVLRFWLLLNLSAIGTNQYSVSHHNTRLKI